MLFEELAAIKLDVKGLREVRRTDEAYKVLKNLHTLCCRGLADRKELGVGFVINTDIPGNMERFYSINERVAGLVIKLKRYKFKVVQACAPKSSYHDQLVKRFHEEAE